VKVRRKVGEGDDIVTIEDTSDEEDGETLQERFQLWSRFSRPGLPHVPLIDDRPTSLEASLPTPPRKPRNVARKHVAKKLKVTEATAHEVSSLNSVVEYLLWSIARWQLISELSRDIPSSDPADQGGDDNWDTMGGATERSLSPAPTIEETVPEMARRATITVEPRAPAEERRLEPSETTGTMEPVVAHVEEEAPAEATFVDIASILGAPTVTVVRSSL
jgi:hypothetical protein